MEHLYKNYAGRDPVCSDGDLFRGCNLAQPLSGTKILQKRSKLTFERCNLARAVVPVDSKLIGCNVSQERIPDEPPDDPQIDVTSSELTDLLDKADAAGVEKETILQWRRKLQVVSRD